MTDVMISHEELADDQLDQIRGGAVFAKYDGVDGEASNTAPANDQTFEDCDPFFRGVHAGAGPTDLKRG